MMKFFIALIALTSPIGVQAKSVFAHFMVGNTAKFTTNDWVQNIQLAKGAGIDAFALNIARNESTTTTSLPNAFAAAERNGFKLFFSFDYAGNGAWNKSDVQALIQKYSKSSAYFFRGSQPFVSTFEGPANADDWHNIKTATGCFFIPDWSSLGAQAAIGLSNGVADGLFSWDAWPKGPSDTNTYPDASYHQFLTGKPYMAPVSPWFYTNLPGYTKNWLWRGDSLWFDRWQQLIALDFQPEFLQIISWNDYGESHYIGPLDNRQYSAFEIGRAPFNYVDGMPHDGWRNFLPFLISMWKNGVASVTQEGVVGWYRLNPSGACSDGGTTGNTASQLQLEYPPGQIVQDKVFFAALLGSAADVSVTIGGASVPGSWTSKPYGGVGVYFGSAPTNGATGAVKVTVSRGGGEVAHMDGQAMSNACPGGLANWNAWVGSGWGNSIGSVSPPKKVSELNCTAGFGFGNFNLPCNFTCANGYCPSGACTCTALGIAKPPPITNTPGYPLAGESPSYNGICSFACNHGYCPSNACGYTQQPTVLPTTGEFLPPTCTGGTGPSPFNGLCDYGCYLGFCPMHLCTCTSTGALHVPPSGDNSIQGFASDGYQDFGMCTFACQRNYCPYPCSNGTGPGGIFIEPGIPDSIDVPWPLLYIADGATTVHLDHDTGNIAKNLLTTSNTCPHRNRRRDATTDCITATFDFLVSQFDFLTAIVHIYLASPTPGSPKDLTYLPRYAEDAQNAALIHALLRGADQLDQIMFALSDDQVLYISYAILNIAMKKLWVGDSNNYDSYPVGRSGRNQAQCPTTDDLPCSHQLCKGGNDSKCTGFFSPCSCKQGNSCPNQDGKQLTLLCDICGGPDVLTGRCVGNSDGKFKDCPCASDVPDEPYIWPDLTQWNSALSAYYGVLNGKDYSF